MKLLKNLFKAIAALTILCLLVYGVVYLFMGKKEPNLFLWSYLIVGFIVYVITDIIRFILIRIEKQSNILSSLPNINPETGQPQKLKFSLSVFRNALYAVIARLKVVLTWPLFLVEATLLNSSSQTRKKVFHEVILAIFTIPLLYLGIGKGMINESLANAIGIIMYLVLINYLLEKLFASRSLADRIKTLVRYPFVSFWFLFVVIGINLLGLFHIFKNDLSYNFDSQALLVSFNEVLSIADKIRSLNFSEFSELELASIPGIVLFNVVIISNLFRYKDFRYNDEDRIRLARFYLRKGNSKKLNKQLKAIKSESEQSIQLKIALLINERRFDIAVSKAKNHLESDVYKSAMFFNLTSDECYEYIFLQSLTHNLIPIEPIVGFLDYALSHSSGDITLANSLFTLVLNHKLEIDQFYQVCSRYKMEKPFLYSVIMLNMGELEAWGMEYSETKNVLDPMKALFVDLHYLVFTRFSRDNFNYNEVLSTYLNSSISTVKRGEFSNYELASFYSTGRLYQSLLCDTRITKAELITQYEKLLEEVLFKMRLPNYMPLVDIIDNLEQHFAKQGLGGGNTNLAVDLNGIQPLRKNTSQYTLASSRNRGVKNDGLSLAFQDAISNFPF